MNEDAFDGGVAAGIEGRDQEDCPYPPASRERVSWMRGYASFTESPRASPMVSSRTCSKYRRTTEPVLSPAR